MIRRCAVACAAVAAALALPAAALAHAALLRTVPSPSGTVNTPPKQVLLTYSEAVEPRFAIVSVTDVNASRVTSGSPHRSPTDPSPPLDFSYTVALHRGIDFSLCAVRHGCLGPYRHSFVQFGSVDNTIRSPADI